MTHAVTVNTMSLGTPTINFVQGDFNATTDKFQKMHVPAPKGQYYPLNLKVSYGCILLFSVNVNILRGKMCLKWAS